MRYYPTSPQQQRSDGFTLIEVLVAFGIIAVLFAISFVSLGHPQQAATVTGIEDKLLADIKSQQILAMSGDNGGSSVAQPHGIYIETTQFTLFAGSSYNPADTYNYAENAGTVQLSTTLPGATLIFAKGTGEVSGYAAGQDTITLTNGNTTHTITINRLGTATVQ